MPETRRQKEAMNNSTTKRIGSLRMGRFLATLLAALIAALVLAGTASARQVYEWVYSGEYVDGAGTDNGVFPSRMGQIAIDQDRNEILVTVGPTGQDGAIPGYVTKVDFSNNPAEFDDLAPGVDTFVPYGPHLYNGRPAIAIDDTTKPTNGNFYITGRNQLAVNMAGFDQGGQPLPNWQFSEGPFGIAVDQTGEILTSKSNTKDRFSWLNAAGEVVDVDTPFLALEEPIENLSPILSGPHGGALSFDGDGNVFEMTAADGTLFRRFLTKFKKIDSETFLEEFKFGRKLTNDQNAALAVDPATEELFSAEESTVNVYDPDTGAKLTSFGAPEPGYEGLSPDGSFEGGATGVAVDHDSHAVWVANERLYAGAAHRVEKFIRTGPITVPTTETDGVDTSATSATLHGTINPEGLATTDCHFEWGTVQWDLSVVQPCAEGPVITGSDDVAVTGELTGLIKGKTYWYRLVSKNSNGRVIDGGPEKFIAQGTPVISNVYFDRVNTDGVTLNATIDPNGGRTRFFFEYGPTTAYGYSTPVKRVIKFDGTKFVEKLPESLLQPGDVEQEVTGLESGKTYYYRVVAINEQNSAQAPGGIFKTHLADPAVDPCPNSHVRQQVEATLLDDCRAYELVSPANAGGYDVESDIVPGQVPLVTSPDALNRVLFSIHDGMVPGIAGSPTNFGRDPYVAHRGLDGWSTAYVGLPSHGMQEVGPFASPLLAADSALETFAFGGNDICDPCFADGSTNIPLRLRNGQIVKGMAGSLAPVAESAQKVIKPFSSDGSHFVFGSNEKFELAGGDEGSIYDRDLRTGTTQVISTLPNGSTMPGGNVSELDISEDGSRIVVAQRVSVDGKGNEHVHPYMHIGTSPNSVDLAPGTSSGVLFAGMSGDGARSFYLTPDQLLGADSDDSTDLYEAAVNGGGTLDLRLISTKAGVASNDDSCTPPGSPTTWNTISGDGKCNAVILAGGAGVARGNGALYFLSPERLDGSKGAEDQVNLYLVKPGSHPEFVATIESSLAKPPPPPPNHPVLNPALVTGLEAPEAVTIDQTNGDIYVVERTPNRITRWDSGGVAKNFTAGPGAGTNAITGLTLGNVGRAQVAVDNAPGSPFNGRIYAKKSATTVGVYAPTGEELGTLIGFNEVCGLTVDQSSGVLYVGDRTGARIRRLAPVSGTPPVQNANYLETAVSTIGLSPCHVAADSLGQVYAAGATTGPVRKFQDSEFAAIPPAVQGVPVTSVGTDLVVDPTTDDLYVDEANQIARFDSTGALIQKFGSGAVGTNSRGVAIDGATGHVFATNGGNSVVKFGVEPVPYVPIDHPAVVHGLEQAGVHSYGDFQVTPDGRYALFSSIMPLTGHPNASNSEIFRFDSVEKQIDCVSCPITFAPATEDAVLSEYGLNLADDGRVFFTTPESLVLRDTNERKDAYQWSDGVIQLISTGTSPQDSAILSASRDGKDVFFFTYDTLVHEDENGNTMKIYTAREGGGFEYDPPLLPCAASDECHGAGTKAPDPPKINTVEGAGNRPAATPKRCKKRFVKKRGKCVKKKSKKRQRRKSKSPRG
jgi:hypothetical protein